MRPPHLQFQSRPIAIVATILATTLTVGCTTNGDEFVGQVARTYGYGVSGHTLEPIVLVPGFLGSTLVDRDSGHELWGLFLAGEQRIWRADVQRRLALPMTGGDSLAELRDAVEPSGAMANAEIHIVGHRFVVNAYPGLLMAILHGLSGAKTDDATPSQSELRESTRAMQGAIDPRIHSVAYDWRRDLVESTLALEEAITAAHQQKLDMGLRGEAARVDVVAHSMGTLIARYYLRYGTQLLADDGSLPRLTWEPSGPPQLRHRMGPGFIQAGPTGPSPLRVHRYSVSSSGWT